MTDADMVSALGHCTFGAGSWDKRFVRDMGHRLAAHRQNSAISTIRTGVLTEPFEVSLKQHEQLVRLVHSYREQLLRFEVECDCDECRPLVDWRTLWVRYCRPKKSRANGPVSGIYDRVPRQTRLPGEPKPVKQASKYGCRVCGETHPFPSDRHSRGDSRVWRRKHNTECARVAVEKELRLRWARGFFTDREREAEERLIGQGDGNAKQVLADFYLEKQAITPDDVKPREHEHGPLFASVQP